MGFDTLVDRDRLEHALTATADAIREKSGTALPLRWDPDSGFRQAVSELQAGSSLLDSLIDRSVEQVESRAVSVGANAFRQCDYLKTVVLPEAVSFGFSSFYSCVRLESVTAERAQVLDTHVFYGDLKLQRAVLPQVRTMGIQCFRNCYALTEVQLPRLEQLEASVFYGCRALQSLRLPAVTAIGEQAFRGCTALKTLILDRSCTLGHTNAFENTPMAAGTGFVYVPRALLEDFLADTNWAVYSDVLRAQEDYPEIMGG